MFKKLLLAIGISFLSSSAFAACTNPLTILNSASATVNMSVSQNTADAGCMYNITPNQGGAPISATNGWWTNILQGNVVLSSGNPLFSQLTAGSAIVGKFGIDQTTPGTTNAVQANAGTNLNTSALSLAATQGTTADSPASVPTSSTVASEIALLKALVNVANSAVTLGSASGGWSPKLLNALSTTVTAIKSSAAGQLGLLQCSNSNTVTVFIQVFDVATAGAVTLGTTVPKLSFEVPPGTPSGYTLPLVGIQFANGIQVAATTTATGLTAQSGTLPNCNAGFN